MTLAPTVRRGRVPLADAASLRPQLRRTRAVRLGLAAAALAAAAAALVLAVRLASEDSGLLPPGEGGLVVLDVSSSITADTYRQVVATIDEIAASRRRFGLVLFSDTAYEALPPGTRAAELAGFRRFFRPIREGEAADATGRLRTGGVEFPANPWALSFTGGTQISSGLILARSILARDRVEDPAVVLMSDLATDQFDVASLGNVVRTLAEEDVPLRVVSLSANEPDRLFFRELLRGQGTIVEAPRATRDQLEGAAARAEPAFPVALAAAAGLLLVLLAANELWCGRLVWLRRRG